MSSQATLNSELSSKTNFPSKKHLLGEFHLQSTGDLGTSGCTSKNDLAQAMQAKDSAEMTYLQIALLRCGLLCVSKADQCFKPSHFFLFHYFCDARKEDCGTLVAAEQQ